MFFSTPGKPTIFKKIIYLLASTILGIFLSYLAHALIEINYLSWAAKQGSRVCFYGACALWPWLQPSFWVIGAMGGFFLGRFWWRKLYIERVWLKKHSAGR